MWTYRQASGQLLHDGAAVATGYSGHGEGKNNPALQAVRGVGPLPQGRYRIDLEPHCKATLGGNVVCVWCGGTTTHNHGPFVLELHPHFETKTFNRGGFLIHGDSTEHPGEASHGCMIFPRAVRERIAASGDDQLEVTA